MELCKYRDIFGKPKTGAHSYRIFDIAIIDLGLTFVLAYIIANKYKKPLHIVFLALIILSIIMHKMFCVKTTLSELI